ncbi:MAG: alpha/beta hydrolase [Firmicutes bacterium]|jgi:acetyl esterase/lipase|nr:alpha/beta hydrolase [Bacillota bacterium]
MLEKKNVLRGITVFALFLSLVSLIYGIIYVAMPGKAPFLNFFGVLILLAFTTNILVVYLNNLWGASGKLNAFGTFYLLFFFVAILGIWFGNLQATNTLDNVDFNRTMLLAVYPSFFGILGFGIIHLLMTLAGISDDFPIRKRFSLEEIDQKTPFLKKILLLLIYILYLPSFFLAYVLLTCYFGMTQILVCQFGIFWAFYFFTLALLILKIYKKTPSGLRYLTGITGLAIFIIFLSPLFAIPRASTAAEANFAAAFGEGWRAEIDPSDEVLFLPSKISIPAYFLGTPPVDFIYEQDVLFYEGTEGVDEGIRLYFDVFMPAEDNPDLPGWGSTLIRVHGGAWIAGSKGVFNMMPMNKYLASQGYTVFDVEYGLSDRIDLLMLNEMYDFIGFLNKIEIPEAALSVLSLGAPEYLTGPFSLDDMVRHLGIFSYYLEEHAAEYGANLDSVFISGGSAGGHFTTAMALAISGGQHQELFSPELDIKGFIPFYPANKEQLIFEKLGGADEWKDVELLVEKDSPPCLIYQGMKDGMVAYETSTSFQERYREAGNNDCAIIYLPLAAHASDFYFNGYFNRLFLYYMERFMVMQK